MSPSKNRRLGSQKNRWLSYVGNCTTATSYLNSKNTVSLWLAVKFLDALLRGFGQILFANNPLSGVLVITALFIGSPLAAAAGILTASVGLITSVALQQPPGATSAGLTVFNSVLIGAITVTLVPSLYSQSVDAKLWLLMIVGSILCVYLTTAMNRILSFVKLPCITAPFNVVEILLFLCVIPQNADVSSMQDLTQIEAGLLQASANITMTSNSIHEIIWGEVFSGVVLSSGQIFALLNIPASVVLYLAVFIFSPLLALFCLMGATIGTVAGLLFTDAPYEAVYTGLYGYNGLVSAAAIGGFFYVLTWQSAAAAVMNVIFSAALQHAVGLAFASSRLPVLTVPFTLSTLLFLSMTSEGTGFTRPESLSFPEKHRYDFQTKPPHKQNCLNSSNGDKERECSLAAVEEV